MNWKASQVSRIKHHFLGAKGFTSIVTGASSVFLIGLEILQSRTQDGNSPLAFSLNHDNHYDWPIESFKTPTAHSRHLAILSRASRGIP